MLKRITGIILLLGCLTIIVAEVHAADWYDSNWSYRKAITVQAGQVTSGPHAEFPILVSLSSDSDLAAKAQPDFDDILFTSFDGTTKLDHEIESYNSGTGALIAWVEVSSIDNGTVIYMYYGNSSAGSQQNVTGTWNSNYTGVWHLKEEQSGTGTLNLYQDSASNNNDGDDYVSATGQSGQINSGQELDGSNDYINIGNDASLNFGDSGSYSIEWWIKKTGTFKNYDEIISKGVTANQRIHFLIDSTGNLHRWAGLTSGSTIPLNEWVHIVYTYSASGVNNGTEKFYANGTETNTRTGSMPTWSAANDYWIGFHSFSGGNWPVEGLIDEVRISDVAHSPGWIQTEYNNQNNPSAFHGSPGSEESTFTWDGSSSTDWGTAANWDVNAVPGTGHTVFIPNVTNAPTLDLSRTIAALTVNGESLTLNGNSLTVTGDLTITGNGVLNAGTGSPTITVGSNWDSSAGTFTEGTSTIKMTGSPSKTLTLNRNNGWSAYSHNIIIDTGADITYLPNSSNISGNLTINDNATFNSSINLRMPDPTKTIILGNNATLNIPVGYLSLQVDDSSSYLPTTGTITGAGLLLFCVETGNTAGRMTARSYNVDIVVATAGSAAKAVLGGGTGTLDLNGNDLFLWDKSQNCAGYATLDNSADIPIVNGGLLEVAPTWNTAAFVGKLIAHDATYDFASVDIYNGGEIDGATGSGTSTWTVTGNVIFKHANTVLNAGGSGWTVGGNWNNTNSGTFTSGTGTVTFNGSGDQTITSGGSAFYNLTLNNPGSSFVTNGNLDVDGTLTITAGDLDLDTNDPDVYNSGDIMIDTNGSVTKGTGTWTFDGTTNFTDDSSTGPQNLGTVMVD